MGEFKDLCCCGFPGLLIIGGILAIIIGFISSSPTTLTIWEGVFGMEVII